MSGEEQRIGKDAEEAEDLAHFLAAYREVTGERLTEAERGPDPPDFLCARRDGTIIGVELTRVVYDDGYSPRSRLRSVWDTGDFMTASDAVVGLHPPEWRGYHPNEGRGKPYG